WRQSAHTAMETKPAEKCSRPAQTATITCSHDIQDYTRILWYKQLKNNQMQLLGYMNVNKGYPETGMNVKIDGGANRGQTCTLSIENLSLSSSSVWWLVGFKAK
uniref:Immunoglobulin V-set domain-containing protein n=1 Tax=Acanthochromis polyacanthus TaxID=80966 RepID=A0A3Q1EVP7_9TELE